MGTTNGRKIGDLAAATGLTVRTLHHYEEVGLLPPPDRTDGGHRVYDDEAVGRLYRICALRRLGLPLGEIGRALDDPSGSLPSVMARHLADVDRRLDATARLRSRLAGLVAAGDSLDADDLLTLLEETTMLETTVQRRIGILVYADLEAANDFLTDVFGLGPSVVTRDPDGNVVHVELQAGDGVVWLHPEVEATRIASPRTLGGTTALMAVMVDDVDAHFRHVQAKGATIEYEPVDQPYGYREYSARDLEGGFWSFMKPLD